MFVYLSIGTMVGITPTWLVRTSDRPRVGASWRAWLHQADADVTPAQFVGVSLGLGLAVGTAVALFIGVPAIGAVAAMVACAIPHLVISRRRQTLVRPASPLGLTPSATSSPTFGRLCRCTPVSASSVVQGPYRFAPTSTGMPDWRAHKTTALRCRWFVKTSPTHSVTEPSKYSSFRSIKGPRF
jgi:hypothetical protein